MKRKLTDVEIFKVGSTYARHALKARIIKDKLVSYSCACCGNPGLWMNKTLVLQLDHVNGIFNDNRLENLQFLCANCHSQTTTYAGKNSIGKRTKDKPIFDYRSSKRTKDKEKWEKIKEEKSIDFSKRGWVGLLSIQLNITPQKVGKWLMRVDPEFYASLK